MDIVTRAVGCINYLDSVADSRSASTLFLNTSWIPIGAIAAYLLFVLWLGPRFMANRKRYDLTKIIQIYNLIQIAANLYLSYQLCWPYFQFSVWCRPHPYYETEKVKANLFNCCYYFYVLKLLDFMDTAFFILRKKQSQVTFLHVFHHIGILIIAWAGTMFYLGDSKMLAVSINGLVHAVMYAYYFLSSLHFPGTSIFKPYVTIFQLLQFVIITGHLSLTVVLGLCNESRNFSMSVVAFNVLMFILFMRFYKRSYKRQGHSGFVHKME